MFTVPVTVTVAEQLSAAVAPGSVKISPTRTVIFAAPSKVMVGAILSSTVTFAVAVEILPVASVAVKVTVLVICPAEGVSGDQSEEVNPNAVPSLFPTKSFTPVPVPSSKL